MPELISRPESSFGEAEVGPPNPSTRRISPDRTWARANNKWLRLVNSRSRCRRQFQKTSAVSETTRATRASARWATVGTNIPGFAVSTSLGVCLELDTVRDRDLNDRLPSPFSSARDMRNVYGAVYKSLRRSLQIVISISVHLLPVRATQLPASVYSFGTFIPT